MKPPRFTLRDLFWLVLVAGMALGWFLEWQRTRIVGDFFWKHQGNGPQSVPVIADTFVHDTYVEIAPAATLPIAAALLVGISAVTAVVAWLLFRRANGPPRT